MPSAGARAVIIQSHCNPNLSLTYNRLLSRHQWTSHSPNLPTNTKHIPPSAFALKVKASRLVDDMMHAAKLYTESTEGWSDRVGMYFHAFPHASVNALHMVPSPNSLLEHEHIVSPNFDIVAAVHDLHDAAYTAAPASKRFRVFYSCHARRGCKPCFVGRRYSASKIRLFSAPGGSSRVAVAVLVASGHRMAQSIFGWVSDPPTLVRGQGCGKLRFQQDVEGGWEFVMMRIERMVGYSISVCLPHPRSILWMRGRMRKATRSPVRRGRTSGTKTLLRQTC